MKNGTPDRCPADFSHRLKALANSEGQVSPSFKERRAAQPSADHTF